jgi:hypothetical protein
MYTFHAIVLLPVSAKEKTENTIQQAAKNLEKKKKPTSIKNKTNNIQAGSYFTPTICFVMILLPLLARNPASVESCL